MMPTVELVYDRQCPSVPEARAHLLSAFVQAGLTPKWSEFQIGDADVPEHARGYGSPTILIDGRDVSGAVVGAEMSCRLYKTEQGHLSRAPAISEIVAALASAATVPRPMKRAGGWGASFAMLPGIGAALLPKVACPACWPAYAGFLSSLGLGFLMETTWLLPLTSAFLVIALGALAFRARSRRGHGPLALGAIAAAIVLLGKFVFEIDAAMYAGIGVLVAASLWNSWPRRRAEACPACATPV
jgi:mercuric ion transport protein